MQYYIYRNSTIEYLFKGINASFSGYEDISLPLDHESKNYKYIFFYVSLPFIENKIFQQQLDSYLEKINFIANNIRKGQELYIFELTPTWNLGWVSSENNYDYLINNINEELYNLTKQNNSIKIINFNKFINFYAKDYQIDWKYYFSYSALVNPKLSLDFKKWFINQMSKINLKRKKCLVLDLDNTLWGGVIGEDGGKGILLSEDYPGKIYKVFQEMILSLKSTGIILTIASKNNESDIKEVFNNHPQMVLKYEDFIIKKINWKNKDQNISEISRELNIGLESMVFIDDSPFERSLVKESLPAICIPNFPYNTYDIPSYFYKIFDKYFSIYETTDEDLKKNLFYQNKIKIKEMESNFCNYKEFIKNLNINIEFNLLNNDNDIKNYDSLKRVAQLTQKTNQFNLTLKRFQISEIEELINNNFNDNIIAYIKVQDKFGENGIVGVSIVKLYNTIGIAELNTFLISCRALGRGIENIFFKQLLNLLFDLGYKSINAKYINGPKNIQMQSFLEKFNPVQTIDDNKSKEYKFNIDNKFKISSLYKTSYNIKKSISEVNYGTRTKKNYRSCL